MPSDQEDIGSIMSFYFGPIRVGWVYIEPPHFETGSFSRQEVDYETLEAYYPDLVTMNIHLKLVRERFSDAAVVKIQSRNAKEFFKAKARTERERRNHPTTFDIEERFREYFYKISRAIRTSDNKLFYSASTVEFKSLQQAVYTLYLLAADKFIDEPLLIDEDI